MSNLTRWFWWSGSFYLPLLTNEPLGCSLPRSISLQKNVTICWSLVLCSVIKGLLDGNVLLKMCQAVSSRWLAQVTRPLASDSAHIGWLLCGYSC